MDVDLRWVGGIMYRNSEIEETGLAAGVLGHPALGVVWLANKLGQHGTTLQAGHLILAGSFTRVVHAQKGDTLHGDFGHLGSVAGSVRSELRRRLRWIMPRNNFKHGLASRPSCRSGCGASLCSHDRGRDRRL